MWRPHHSPHLRHGVWVLRRAKEARFRPAADADRGAACDDVVMTTNSTDKSPRLRRAIPVIALVLAASLAGGYAVGVGARRLQDDGFAADSALLVLAGLATFGAFMFRWMQQRNRT